MVKCSWEKRAATFELPPFQFWATKRVLRLVFKCVLCWTRKCRIFLSRCFCIMLIRWIFYCVNIFMNAMYHDSWANSSRRDERTNSLHVVTFRACLTTEVVFRELGDANMQFMEVKQFSFHRSSNQLVKWHWNRLIYQTFSRWFDSSEWVLSFFISFLILSYCGCVPTIYWPPRK